MSRFSSPFDDFNASEVSLSSSTSTITCSFWGSMSTLDRSSLMQPVAGGGGGFTCPGFLEDEDNNNDLSGAQDKHLEESMTDPLVRIVESRSLSGRSLFQGEKSSLIPNNRSTKNEAPKAPWRAGDSSNKEEDVHYDSQDDDERFSIGIMPLYSTRGGESLPLHTTTTTMMKSAVNDRRRTSPLTRADVKPQMPIRSTHRDDSETKGCHSSFLDYDRGVAGKNNNCEFLLDHDTPGTRRKKLLKRIDQIEKLLDCPSSDSTTSPCRSSDSTADGGCNKKKKTTIIIQDEIQLDSPRWRDTASAPPKLPRRAPSTDLPRHKSTRMMQTPDDSQELVPAALPEVSRTNPEATTTSPSTTTGRLGGGEGTKKNDNSTTSPCSNTPKMRGKKSKQSKSPPTKPQRKKTALTNNDDSTTMMNAVVTDASSPNFLSTPKQQQQQPLLLHWTDQDRVRSKSPPKRIATASPTTTFRCSTTSRHHHHAKEEKDHAGQTTSLLKMNELHIQRHLSSDYHDRNLRHNSVNSSTSLSSIFENEDNTRGGKSSKT